MSVAPGARVGPYEVLSLLGAGGMGEVYRARDAKLQRDVALKLLPDAVVWADAAGRTEPITLPAGPYQEARVSPDGKRIAFLAGDAGRGEVWIYEVASRPGRDLPS